MAIPSSENSLCSPKEGRRRDGDLLRLYVERRSEEAFTELGRRYAGLIYSTCLREVGDRALAEDAAQGVLLLLSQKASALQRRETIAGWLYTASRYVARNLRKQEQRRQMNEIRAGLEAPCAIAPVASSDNLLWDQVEPHLHAALDRLKPADREAVLLRFVQEQSLAEVGACLGVSENTARMRIQRALEKVRAHLGKMGVAVTVASLAALLEAHSAQAAPDAVIQSLPQVAHRDLPAPFPLVVRWAALRMALPSRHIAPGVLLGLLLLTGSVIGYRLRLPQPLNQTERRRLFASLAGTWTGNLEFADDKTRQRFLYPTKVTFARLDQGDALQFVATYTGSSSVDVTTFRRDAQTGSFSVQNSGPQSSHKLYGLGELVALRDGEFAFLGFNDAQSKAIRLRILLKADRLTLQEEFRKANQSEYQFRNRFLLQRQQAAKG